MGRDEDFVEAAIARGLAGIAVTDHFPFYWLPRERHDPTLAMTPEEFPRYVDAAARSGLFDVLAHLELPRKFGFRPTRPFAGRQDEVVAAVAASGCAVELSSAGRRKPVGENYPATALVRELVASGVALVLSSDAHVPGEVGLGFSDLATAAKATGARELTGFRRRRREPVALHGGW